MLCGGDSGEKLFSLTKRAIFCRLAVTGIESCLDWAGDFVAGFMASGLRPPGVIRVALDDDSVIVLTFAGRRGAIVRIRIFRIKG